MRCKLFLYLLKKTNGAPKCILKNGNSKPLRSIASMSSLCRQTEHNLPISSSSSKALITAINFPQCFQSRFFCSGRMNAEERNGIIEIPLAQTGEGIAECELLQWFVKEGDEIEEFQPLCEVQSDKATLQITSRYKGLVLRLKFLPGDIIKVGETLVEVVAEDDGNTSSNDSNDELVEQLDHCLEKDECHSKSLATPAVRSLAKKYGLDLENIFGSGKGGRITKEDVMMKASHRGQSNEVASKEHKDEMDQILGQDSGDFVKKRAVASIPEDQTIHVRGYQRVMVKTMTAAVSIPHFHFIEEITIDALVRLKERLHKFIVDQNLKITYLPFLIKALSLALSKYPLANSTCNEDASQICLKGVHNIGVAIASSHGLAVPNIKCVQDLSILEISKELTRLTGLASTNKLSSEDLADGTITISNFGSIGGKFGCPILNVPQVAIVGVGRIQKLPRVSDDGNIYPASVMNLSWGADHRVLDGATVAKVSNELKNLIEKPEQLLIQLR